VECAAYCIRCTVPEDPVSTVKLISASHRVSTRTLIKILTICTLYSTCTVTNTALVISKVIGVVIGVVLGVMIGEFMC
jgi:ABC-type nitrate/sulfonate/bicarbonate transport system permease component